MRLKTKSIPVIEGPDSQAPVDPIFSGHRKVSLSIPPVSLQPELIRAQTLLFDASKRKLSGEVVLRKGAQVGRVYFVDGQVVWVHAVGERGVFIEHVVERHGVDRDVLTRLIRECKQQGLNLTDYLVDQGVVDQQRLRASLRAHLRGQLQSILRAEGQLDTLFLPVTRPYEGGQSFSLGELLSPIDLPEADGYREVQADQLWARAQELLKGTLATVLLDGQAGTQHLRTEWELTTGQKAALDHLVSARELGFSHLTDGDGDCKESISWGKELMVYERTCGAILVLVVSDSKATLGRFIHDAKAVVDATQLPLS